MAPANPALVWGIIVATLGVGHQQPQQPNFTILFPQGKRLLVTAPAATVTGRFDQTIITEIELLERFETKKFIDVSTKVQKESFAKEVREMFPDNVILDRVLLKSGRLRAGDISSKYPFQPEENVDLRKFWASNAFREMLAQVYDSRVLSSEVTLSGWLRKRLSVSSKEYQQRFGDTFSFSTSLVPGMNNFYVRAIGEIGNVASIDSVSFFYQTEVGTDIPPPDLDRQAFHDETNEVLCESCHSLTLPETTKEENTSLESECSPCHRGLVNQKSVHYPALDWDCLLCHDPDSSPKYQLYTDKDYGASLCFECHPDKQEDVNSKPSVHGIVEECRTCHDPHGSRNDAVVVDRVNRICSVCHEEIAETPHPVVGHPLEGRPDPTHPGKELSCATCHNPHASEHEYLLFAPKLAVCQNCHQK
ncbi:MAG: cytochrome c3 family protein [Bacteroidota bacterium]